MATAVPIELDTGTRLAIERTRLASERAEFGEIPRSVAGPVAGVVALLGVLALITVVLRA